MESIQARAPSDPRPPDPKISGYTNFPTVMMADHALLLRTRWPEDLAEPQRESQAILSNPLLNRFGTTGEILALSDASGQTIAAQRICLHRSDPLPDSGSAAWPGALSSLRTALRYSRLGWLEVGPLQMAKASPDSSLNAETSQASGDEAITSAESSAIPTVPTLTAALMWQGISRLLERNGLGFALGLTQVPPTDADAPVTDGIPLLLERYGLDPEFAYRPRKFSGTQAPATQPLPSPELALPGELREALRRGAKLCGEPHIDTKGSYWFFWAYARS